MKLPIPDFLLETGNKGIVFQQIINRLIQSVKDCITAFNNQIDAAETARQYANTAVAIVDAADAAKAPVYSYTKNQEGFVLAGDLSDYIINNALTINFSEHLHINTGIQWNARTAEEQEIMAAMGMLQRVYFVPSTIRVVKMVWSGNPSNSSHAFYQTSALGGHSTTACYCKLISGSVTGQGFTEITNQWKLCGINRQASPGAYVNDHPYLTSPSGEIHFVWYATVAGWVPLDSANPVWGLYKTI